MAKTVLPNAVDAPENLANAGGPFRFGRASKTGKVAMRFQKSLLHQVRGIDLALQPPANLQTRKC